jgi:death-on-curing protein
MQLYFLTFEDIIEIHDDQIKRYGGSHGLRDKELLLSAIAQPQSTFDGKYLHQSIFDKAAAYLFHLCQNHPFIDGNKRVPVVSSLTFLLMNDYEIDYNEDELETLVFCVCRRQNQKRYSCFISI